MDRINKIIKKAENLLTQIGAEINKTQGEHGIPIDIYMNDCLGYINTVNKLTNVTKKKKEKAKKKLFSIYLSLQDYKGSERQTRKPFPKGREVSIEEIGGYYLTSADAYKGGLGFSGISSGMFLQNSGPKHDQYWKPPSKSKVRLISPEEYDIIQAEYEENRRDTYEEWEEEMRLQKKELLYEMRKLRGISDTNTRRILIL